MAIRSVEIVSAAPVIYHRLAASFALLQAPAWLRRRRIHRSKNLKCARAPAGYGVIVPVTPTLMTDFFASRHSDVYIHCEDYTSKQAPAPCRDAHSDAVNWSSASSFISNSVLSFALVSTATTWHSCTVHDRH